MTYQSVINRDYKSLADRSRLGRNTRLLHLLLLLAGFGIGIVLFGYVSHDAQAIREAALTKNPLPATEKTVTASITSPEPAAEKTVTVSKPSPPAETVQAEQTQPIAETDDEPAPKPQDAPAAAGSWDQITVRKGDSLARIFAKQGLNPQVVHEIMQLGGKAKMLSRIHPGDTMKFLRGSDGSLLELVYTKNALNGLRIRRNNNGFIAELIDREPEKREASATAVIDSSLFLAAQKAQLSDKITMDLAGIFGWDIDFALDIRKGDSFTVLYDELYLDGEKIDDGKIRAAEFINDGKVYRAVYYTDAEGRAGYYSPDGKNMRKQFLRTPVAFTRISSKFSTGRKHPVLNRIRAHKGVDYAAPAGTPVKATGDGKIIYRARKGGYGKVVILQHGSNRSTLYAHLSRYAKGQKTGTRVRQGQVIGYVGSTGLATGPHLHYEFRVNGSHRNPLTVKLPTAAPLDERFKADFDEYSQSLLAQLRQVREDSTQLAMGKEKTE